MPQFLQKPNNQHYAADEMSQVGTMGLKNVARLSPT